MILRFNWLLTLLAVLVFASCTSNTDEQKKEDTFTEDASIIVMLNRTLTEAILQDGVSPPVSSRSFAYSNVAAYEALVPVDSTRKSFAGQLNGLDALPSPTPGKPINATVSMIVAYNTVGATVTYHDHLLQAVADTLLAHIKPTMSQDVYDNSIAWGDTLSMAIKKWASKDGFKESRSMPRYEVVEGDPSAWVPTPPKYGSAIEPYWGTLRPFVMTSASEFSPGLPVEFSEEKGSDFYNLAKEVYDTVMARNEEKLQIAMFWDCNPAVSENKGHFMGLRRQFTPASHWINITRVACENSNADLLKSTKAYALVSLALADGFISAWDEKFTSNLVRPETYINKLIDPNFRPLLETPLFPEHTSAHSVISMASATVLTDMFGETFNYIDSTNVPYNRPPRTFTSFKEAATEAGMSRMYGGIHYRPAFELGLKQGSKVGSNVLTKVKTEK